MNLSIIVPVGSRRSDIVELYAEYKRGADATGRSYEFIFVLDGPHRDTAAGLAKLRERGEKFVVVGLTRSSGEATALMVGLEQARGEIILTLPAAGRARVARSNDCVVGSSTVFSRASPA